MSASIQFAILAHDHAEILADQLENLAVFVPDSRALLFNGGADAHLGDGLDVETCGLSQPLHLGNLVMFHALVMEWLDRHPRPFDYLVTIDSDMLVIRHGLRSWLDRVMAGSEFMGAELVPIAPDRLCRQTRRFHRGWRRIWQPLFGADRAYRAFNPGLVARREFVEKFVRFPRRDDILRVARRSRLYGIEEPLWATWAGAMGCNPTPNPGSCGLRSTVFDGPGLRAAIAEPDVHMIHKVRMQLDGPDRVIVRSLQGGGQPGDELFSALGVDDPHGERPLRRAAERAKSQYFWLFP